MEEYGRATSFGIKVQVAFWVVLFTSVVYLSTLAIGWPDSLYRNMVVFICHTTNFYAFYSLIVPKYYEKKKYAAAFTGLFFVLLAITPLRYWVEREFGITSGNMAVTFGNAGRLGFILFTEIAIAAFASLVRLAVNNEESKHRLAALGRIQLEAELRFLKAQMSPHFLFNSINNIYSLTLINSDKAPGALMKLSGLLRYLLYESHGMVPLMKEIEALKAYQQLFQLRFENPVNFSIKTQVVSNDLKIEPLLLLPLLENTIKHSGLGLSDNAYGYFTIVEEPGHLAIVVTNTKTQRPITGEPGGIGLINIRKRLDMIYPGRHIFEIKETTDSFTVTLKLPKA